MFNEQRGEEKAILF